MFVQVHYDNVYIVCIIGWTILISDCNFELKFLLLCLLPQKSNLLKIYQRRFENKYLITVCFTDLDQSSKIIIFG